MRRLDALVVGASLSGAAVSKRLVDAGLDAVVIERAHLPRKKTCSGILSPRGHRFLIENFGPLPKEALHKPTACRGVTFHFRGDISLPMDFHYGTTAHLNRKHSDHWAIRQSRVEVHDATRFTGLKDMGTHVEVSAVKDGEPVRYEARYVIGADGPNSNVRNALYDNYRKRIDWFKVKHFIHEVVDCPLDEEYFHFWFNPDLGFYTWSHRREPGQIVGVGYEVGDNLLKRHDKTVRFLEEKHSVRLGRVIEQEGSINNFGLSLINRYVFGKGRVLVTGQAAGFLNMIAEGMSCALHSGAIAGEAVADGLRSGREPQALYRDMISSEVRRCSDQWNPFMILFRNPHEADFMETAKRLLSPSERRTMWLELGRFLYPWGKFNWGRKILYQGMKRNLMGHYCRSTWL
jgi:flavin-dependent dehydrogenase